MLPIWPQYYDDCLMVMYVVDLANYMQLAPATVELYELLSSPVLKVGGGGGGGRGRVG